METPLFFQILIMKDSYFVWIGTQSIEMTSMFASVPSAYVSTLLVISFIIYNNILNDKFIKI